MSTHRLRLFLLVAFLILFGGASVLRAQEDFKGVRPPNPEVRRISRPAPDRRANVKQPKPTVNEQIEAALQDGNMISDEADRAEAPPEMRRENFRPAEEEYRKVLALNPREARGYYGLGNALTGQDRFAEAEQAYSQALNLNPQYAEVYFGLGNLSQAKGGSDAETMAFYKKAISLKPDFDHAYLAIGFRYEMSKQESEAMTWYQDAIRHKPDSGPAYVRLASLYAGQKRYPEAIEQYKQAIRFRDRDGYVHLASLYGELKRFPEAIEVFQQWIRFKPSEEAYALLASLYEELERYPEAVAAYQQAVRLEPDNEYARYQLGLAYLKVKNKSAAMKQYRELKKLESPFADELLEEINKE